MLALALPLALCVCGHAHARRVRRLFEPTDLDLEEPGMLQLDLQFGIARSRGPARILVPDFELDLGLLERLEFDLDGGYAIEGPAQGPFAFDHAASDNLWPAFKLGLYDSRDAQARSAFALGLQVGPKLPVAAGAHGLGVESLLLIGTAFGPTHLVWNAGAFIDPDPDSDPGRPIGVELGVDLEVTLSERCALQGGVSGTRFLSSDPHQLLFSAGVTWSPSDALDLSLSTFVGVLEGSDRYGILLGVAPSFRLFDAD